MIESNLFKTLVKTTVLLQSTLEMMDDIKGTSLYRQGMKNKIKNLEKTIEYVINDKVKALDMTDSNLFDEIKSKVDIILDMTLEEIGGLKVVLEETRANELKDWQEEILDKEINKDPFGEHFDVHPNSAEPNKDAYQNGTHS
jgi:hypothetical protein